MMFAQPSAILRTRERTVVFPRRPLIMGILNINDDSFSGDGRIETEWAVDRAVQMIAEGADIVDVGSESARTNRAPISEEEEWRRLQPFLERFGEILRRSRPRDGQQLFPPLLSINTWRSSIAKHALEAGCDILNDISALPEDSNARLCAETGTALLIMHSQGEPKVAYTHANYSDIMAALDSFFSEKLALAMRAGVARDQVILDPGIDFAKQTAHNLQIYRDLLQLARFERPILLPVSRKSVIGQVLGIETPADRDAGTIACMVAGCQRGAAIFRVHNIPAAWYAIRTLEALQ